ncbi:unnamed protein product [Spirodela intermedia]|uniref:Guanylate kinase 1 n=1 Tax=Spirodela intermedia TaxID=51605 RepID=A0A7I8JY79_SPIIN|nr:unnamed protein product [Spirodela intermedia]
MGEEAHASVLDCLGEDQLVELDSGSNCHQTVTFAGEKIFVIGEFKDDILQSCGVRIFDKSTGKWTIPTVLGSKPVSIKAHSAILLGKDRILVVKQNLSLDGCAWFLEIDTPFIREQRSILGTEVVAWIKGVIEDDSPVPIVISGPSGVGKGTLIMKLMKEFPSTFGFSVSHTTRLPREKEKDGVHYHFAQRSIMEKDIRDGKFLEYASVHGNLYGTSFEAVEAVADQGKRCILDIDVQGARSVRASPLKALFIFICPPSFEELENRLRSRGTETEEQVQRRLSNAWAELEQGKSSNLFDHVLVNDELEACYRKLKKILALHGSTEPAYPPSPKSGKLPVCRSISRSDEKILIHGKTAEAGTRPSVTCTVEASLLSGGAPGRTKGLKLHETSSDSPGNGLNGIRLL